ncbi:MAG: NYN domain-containing protein [Myxococcales bacterium]|nr:NYN domain-containing protein [Myxococcales bacterium]
MASPNRAVLFVDGNNWYHTLKAAGVGELARLDYVKIAQKIVGPRSWQATRYYIGQVSQTGNTQLYADQRSFLAKFQNADVRNTVHFGRLEQRTVRSEAAAELLHYLSSLKVKIDPVVYKDLLDIGTRHKVTRFMVEKAVDVMLAVDLVVMAERDEFDTAYILSADGDYTHAVHSVRKHGKKVFAVSAGHGYQLGTAVDAFIPIDSKWLATCYR